MLDLHVSFGLRPCDETNRAAGLRGWWSRLRLPVHRATTCAHFILKGGIIVNFTSPLFRQKRRAHVSCRDLLGRCSRVNGLPRSPLLLRPLGLRAGLRHLHARSQSTSTPVTLLCCISEHRGVRDFVRCWFLLKSTGHVDLQRLSDSSLLVFSSAAQLENASLWRLCISGGISCENEILAKTAEDFEVFPFCFVCGRVSLLFSDGIPAWKCTHQLKWVPREPPT